MIGEGFGNPPFSQFSRRRRKSKYAQGKRAVAICDRSGFKHLMRDMVIEPGTGLLVYKGWSDGMWNRVHHPQNFPAPTDEAIGLKNPRPDINNTPPAYLTDEIDGLIVDQNGQPIFVG